MITVDKLTPAWRDAFLTSRNSLFTHASPEDCSLDSLRRFLQPACGAALSRLFDPSRTLGDQLRANDGTARRIECRESQGRRVGGLLTIRSSAKEPAVLETLDRAVPTVKWACFASEYI